jgi:hypothetical protein
VGHVSVAGRSPEPVQQSFWETFTGDSHSSRMIDLLDLAPRLVLYTDSDAKVDGKFLAEIHREFMHHGRTYALEIRPARIQRDGEGVDVYPGGREQLVEEVIRHLAVRSGRLSHEPGDIVRLRFSVYEIREELKRTNHTLGYPEVIEALHILHRTGLSITPISKSTGEKESKGTFHGPIFPQFYEPDPENGVEAMVEFNAMFARAIRHLEFRPISYEMIMRLADPVSRWLYKKLNHLGLFEQRPMRAFEINASDIIRDCGINVRAKQTRTFAKIRDAIEDLKGKGVLEDFSAGPIKSGRSYTDVAYTLIVSESYREDLIRSNRNAADDRALFRELTGEEPHRLVPGTADTREAVRRHRRKQTATLAAPQMPSLL